MNIGIYRPSISKYYDRQSWHFIELLAASSIEVDAPSDQLGDGSLNLFAAPIQGIFND